MGLKWFNEQKYIQFFPSGSMGVTLSFRTAFQFTKIFFFDKITKEMFGNENPQIDFKVSYTVFRLKKDS